MNFADIGRWLRRREGTSRPWRFGLGLALIVVALTAVFAIQVWRSYRAASPQRALETEITAWLEQNTAAGTTILVPEILDLSAEGRTLIHNPAAFNTADYAVTTNTLTWQNLTQTPEFRLDFSPQKEFETARLPFTPVAIWRARPDTPDRRPLHVYVPDRFHLIGYKVAPREADPGQTITVTLYLESLTYQPAFDEQIRTLIRLADPVTRETLHTWDELVARKPAWQRDEVAAYAVALELPDDLEAGAYGLNVSLYGREGEELWPLMQDLDINVLDRVWLAPLAVPQAIESPAETAEAIFGDGLELVGHEISDTSDTEVTLYWQVAGEMDRDYAVFVHVLNEANELVANHDGPPAHGRFPTAGLPLGLTIRDPHPLTALAELPSGRYQVKVGLYLPETGERLPVRDAAGNEPAGRALEIESLER